MSENVRKQIDFLGKRHVFGAMSAGLVALSLVLLVVPGPNYGIDFRGGTNVIVQFTEDMDVAEVRAAVEDMGFLDASVQRFGSGESPQYLVQTQAVTSMTPERQAEFAAVVQATYGDDAGTVFDDASGDRAYLQIPASAYQIEGFEDPETVVTPDQYQVEVERISSELEAALAAAGFEDVTIAQQGAAGDRKFVAHTQALQRLFETSFAEAFGDRYDEIERVETVGPRVGEQLRNDGIQAVLLSLVFILLYIAFRFDLRYAPGAVVALAHDVLITLGIFVILRQEISLPIIAALLTIVGYSLNDTIVNFDRVRENLQMADGPSDIMSVVNRSVNECLSRTLLTSITTLIAVLVIFLLGGGLIRSFALAMIIGVVIGTYSSIYIASPLLVFMTNWLEKRREAEAAAARS